MQTLANLLNVRRSWRNASIGAKYMLALIVSLLLFAGSLANARVMTRDIRLDMSAVEAANTMSADITRAIRLLSEINALSYQYMSFSDENVKKIYDGKRQQLLELTDSLASRLDPSTEAGSHMQEVQSNMASFDRLFENVLISAMEQNIQSDLFFSRGDMTEYVNGSMDALGKIEAEYDAIRAEAIADTYGYLDRTNERQINYFIISALICAAVVLFISRGIRRQMKKLLDVSDRIAAGDLTVRSDIAASKSEIGRLSVSVNRMADNLRKIILAISGMSEKVEDQSGKLRHASAEMETGSAQVAETMHQLAAGTQEQAGSAGEIAQVIGELNRLILGANKENDHLADLSGKLLDIAGQGNRLMRDSMGKMNEINDVMRTSADRVNRLKQRLADISGLVEVVRDIAGRTNILALNAAIEAARAGEAGRGFAVVASEVRRLANQVGESLVTITELVDNIHTESSAVTEALEQGRGQADAGSDMIRLTGETFRDIHEEVARVTEGVGKVGEHLATITRSSDEINRSAENIAAVSEQTAAGVEEVSASIQSQHGIVERVAENARDMTDVTEQLKRQVAAFKL